MAAILTSFAPQPIGSTLPPTKDDFMKRALIAAVAALLLLGACGDDGDSGSGNGNGAGGASDESVETVKSSLLDDEDGFALSDGDAECVAENVASTLGDDRVAEIDWEGDEVVFERDEAEQIADDFGECVELDGLFVESLFAGEDVSDSSQECVADELDSGDVKEMFVIGFSGDAEGFEDAFAPIDEVLQSCLSAEEYDAIS
jgi:hypothetical protein